MAAVGGDAPALPRALLDRYRIGRVIGVGGMSTVYAAHDPLLNRDVAVKVFRARAVEHADVLAQQAEAQLIASLNHYALTTLFDAGIDTTDPDHPQIYLVMEFIPGSDLRSRLLQGPLTVAQVCWLGFDLAEGLGYVHEAGFIHHDIKPANVLLADRGADTRIRGKLTDFGIASAVGAPELGEITSGTAAYLSPEQVEGGDATPRSDVYALGLVLLEALTGTAAYPGGIERSAFARLDRQPEIPEDFPPKLRRLLEQMTARHPADRPTLKDAASRFQTVLIESLVDVERVDPALLAADEAQRLAALHRYDILDSPSEDAFDAVTRMASQLLGTPIAAVSIVDADRVWSKSRVGVDLEEVDRNVSFCSMTNPGHGRAWAIPDALADERTRDNPLVLEDPRVRSYAAAPLVTRDGHHLGALCVYDTRPRRFEEADLANLTDLAGMIMRELELRLSSRRAVFDRD